MAAAIEVSAAVGGEASVALRIETNAPGEMAITLPEAESWTVRVVGDGLWSLPQTLTHGDRPASIALGVWLAATIRGSLLVPDGAERPQSVSLRLASHAQGGHGALEPTMLICPVDEQGRFVCQVPQLSRADLRFRVPGFASRFFWDMDLTSAGHDVGELRLRPGASVVGTVLVASSAPTEDVLIRLLPARQSPFVPLDPDTRDHAIAEGRPDERGRFSLEGLDAGVYRLVASHPELAPTEVAPIRLIEGGQTKIAKPLVLAAAHPIRMSIDPPFDPERADWQLEVERDGASARGPVVAATTTGGYLETKPVPLGDYRVRVLDGRGEELVRHEIAHTAEAGLHALEVSTFRLEGSVSLGEEPLPARVWFRRLEAHLSVDADPKGAFALYLPAEGSWDVEIQSGAPEVRWRRADLEITVGEDGLARLDLDLPATELSGVVVDSSGVSRAGATVDVVEAAPTGRVVSLKTDQLGRFRFHGLEEARYRIAATDREAELSSEAEIVDLVEGADPELHLVLHEEKILEARVVDPVGNPLPETWIAARAFTATGAADPLADLARSTDARGHLRLSLRRSTETVLLTVFAPGFAARGVALEPGRAGDIVVHPEGGALVLEVPEPVAWTAPGMPLPAVVFPRGQRIAFGALAQWARLAGVRNDPQGTRFRFPMLEAGTYRACWIRPDDVANRFHPGSGCVAGELRAGGTLALRMKGAQQGAVR